ncbi:UNVERIFIED_CONTAM: hypothetical protein Slati_4403400 [Sesamum latifolium]|uniref:Uncharacterized protein n=1 Tax=Sesamum latifolium TaxID=2727402 RepID=A0AAW2SQJ0_9LAMI
MDKEGSSPARGRWIPGLWPRSLVWVAGYQVAGSGSLEYQVAGVAGYQVAGSGSLIPGRRCQVADSTISDLHGLNSAVSIKMSHVRFSLGRKV